MRLLAALALAASVAAADTTITGTVVDADGKPVAGADVGSNWEFGSAMKPYDGVKTAEDGTFSITLKYYRPPAGLVAADAGRKNGAAVAIADADVAKPVTLTLAPLVKVSGSISCTDPAIAIASASLQWFAGPARVGNTYAQDPKWTVMLPPGKFKLWVIQSDLKGITKEFEVPAGKDEFDFGDFQIPPTFIATRAGKELPDWKVSDARGVKKDVQLKDYRGKWVLVEFWGFW